MRLVLLILCSVVMMGCGSPLQSTADEDQVAENSAAQPQPLTAAHMADLMAADGARHTVLVLTGPADPTAIQQVFDGIATGSPAWLALVPTIAPELEDAQSAHLAAALSVALAHNAPGVLALIPDHADPALICEGLEGARRAAVDAVTDPGLLAARAACLQAV